MDYFSKFDWENYCISLRGPVCRSSLPDIVGKHCAKILSYCAFGWRAPLLFAFYTDLSLLSLAAAKLPENCELLLTDEFLQNSLEMFSVPSRGIEPNTRAFPVKHLNIIDPLKANNNLGRSVNRGMAVLSCQEKGLVVCFSSGFFLFSGLADFSGDN